MVSNLTSGAGSSLQRVGPALRVLFAFASLAFTMGCAKHAVRKDPGVDFYVGPECHPTLQLIHCDPVTSPPSKCERIAATFDKHCERMVLRNAAGEGKN